MLNNKFGSCLFLSSFLLLLMFLWCPLFYSIIHFDALSASRQLIIQFVIIIIFCFTSKYDIHMYVRISTQQKGLLGENIFISSMKIILWWIRITKHALKVSSCNPDYCFMCLSKSRQWCYLNNVLFNVVTNILKTICTERYAESLYRNWGNNSIYLINP